MSFIHFQSSFDLPTTPLKIDLAKRNLKNKNLEPKRSHHFLEQPLTKDRMQQPDEPVPPLSLETNKAHDHHSSDTQMDTLPESSLLNSDQCQSNETNTQSLRSETCDAVKGKAEAAELLQGAGAGASASAGAVEVKNEMSESSEALPPSPAEKLGTAEENGRETLKRHRIEVPGRIWIPDIWGQEEMLKDWIDCSAFDASLVPTDIKSARAALVQESKRANSVGLRIENRC